MTKTEVMRTLRANGSAQTRRIYRRHGVQGDIFGVSYAVLGKLKRKIKVDQHLAEQLWATGNGDARALAIKIADPAQMTAAKLNAWARELTDRGTAAGLSNLAADARSARSLTAQWTKARNEMVACCGWHTLASIARQDNGLDDAYFEQYLARIDSEIDRSANWARYSMNNALINIGVRNAKLRKAALAVAKRIGKLEIDHGKTGCRTPDAAAYIAKTVAHKKKLAAKRRRGEES